MKTATLVWLNQQFNPIGTTAGRQRLVTFALKLNQKTAVVPLPYTRKVLALYVQGILSIDEVLALVAAQKSGLLGTQ